MICPIFGSGCDMPANMLPTYENVLRCVYWHSKENRSKETISTSTLSRSCEEVANKLEETWKRASIPVIDHYSILRKIRSYHDKYRTLLKSYKARKDVESYRKQIDTFRMKAKVLFDISTCTCKSFESCCCKKERKVPMKEREFLLDQRTERKMVIGSLDRKVTIQKTKAAKRKLEQELYEERNKTLTGVSSCPVDLNNGYKLKRRTEYSAASVTVESEAKKAEDVTPVVTRFPVVARTLDRFGISDRAGAAIVSATLQDVGIISQSNVSNVVDRNKIRRERTKARTILSSQSVLKDYDRGQFGLYFDGRKDRTLYLEDNRREVKIEEHVSLVKEPGSVYIGHVSLNSGKAQIIGKHIVNFLSCVENDIDVTKMVAIGCDGTSVNTGVKGGVIRNMELILKRPLQWFVCQLHANELPLRHLFTHVDGTTTGPRSFTGEIGKLLSGCEKLPVVSFTPIECTLCEVTNKKDLSTDQLYLMEICEAINCGHCSESLLKRNPGNVCHSRWLTTANRILRLYVAQENPTEALVTLATFIVKVYAPMWFKIKTKPSVIYGAQHLHQSIVLSRYLSSDLKAVIDPVIERNGFFGHPENVLISMIADDRNHVKELALRRILKARKAKRSALNQTNTMHNVRTFNLPAFDLSATDYVDLIKWENVTEPPLTERFSDDMISEAIVNTSIISSSILPTFKGFPCHSQATERIVKTVTEASAAVCGSYRRDGFIRNRLESRNLMPAFNTKCDYRPL